MKNRRDIFLKGLAELIHNCGVDSVRSTKDSSGKILGIESFTIDYDDGLNYGDNIIITAEEMVNYLIEHKKDENDKDE